MYGKDFGDLMPDILAEAEMVYVSTKSFATKSQEAAYHNKGDCQALLRRAYPEMCVEFHCPLPNGWIIRSCVGYAKNSPIILRSFQAKQDTRDGNMICVCCCWLQR